MGSVTTALGGLLPVRDDLPEAVEGRVEAGQAAEEPDAEEDVLDLSPFYF